MQNALIEIGVNILIKLAVTLIAVAGAWAVQQLGKTEKLKTIREAVAAATSAAEITVMELQQTTVEKMKEAAADGKLTDGEIEQLGKMLIEKTFEKLSSPTIDVLKAANVDIDALIQSAGEALIAKIKHDELWIPDKNK